MAMAALWRAMDIPFAVKTVLALPGTDLDVPEVVDGVAGGFHAYTLCRKGLRLPTQRRAGLKL
jgi:hypothetical protein